MLVSNGAPAWPDSGGSTPSGYGGLADATPIFADASYYATGQMPLAGQWQAYGQLYKTQLWVNTLVRKLAFATARLPYEVRRRRPGNQQVPEAGGFADLMARPNERVDAFRLWLWTSSTYDVYGEAFWWKIRRPDGTVGRLELLHPTNILIRRNADDSLEYIYTTGSRYSQMPPIPAEDIVPFTNYNPENLQRGLSNLEPLRQTLLNEDASRRATASFWQRGARPSVALRHQGVLSAEAQTRLRAQWEASHAGADLMGGTAILEEGMEAQIISLNSEEMQYVESRKLNREEVCAAFDVPPPVVHILDHATYSNITEQLRSMYRDTMAPRFGLFESIVDHHLAPDFDSTGEVFGRFNMDDVLRGDFETRAEAVTKLVGVGILKPSEGRPMFSLPEAGPEADRLYVNAALVPLGATPTPPSVPVPAPSPPVLQAVRSVRLPPDSKAVQILARVGRDKPNARQILVDEHRRALAAFFGRQRTAVKAALPTKAASGFDPAAWDDDLSGILLTLSTATSQAIGNTVARQLDGTYDAADIADWLHSDAGETATAMNRTTGEELQAALDGAEPDADPADVVDEVFDGPVAARADSAALTRVAAVAGLAGLVAGRQSGATSKTWVVNSAKPRASHAQMHGETVGLQDGFSNGMNAPGDPAGGADEVAGCTCSLNIGKG